MDVSPAWDGGAATPAGDTWRTMSTDANARGLRPTLGHIRLRRFWAGRAMVYNADAVVFLARGETFDQDVGGAVAELGAGLLRPLRGEPLPPGRGRPRLQGGERGPGHAPHDDSGGSLRPGPWPEDDPAGGDRQRDHAGGGGHHPGGNRRQQGLRGRPQHRGLAGGRYAASVGQVNVPCTDGVHFTCPGGIYVGLRLAPELAARGRAHATASPGGSWPGSLPPSTPSWFPNLPYQ